MAGILDFFTPEAGQRRTRALNQLTDDLTYYIPPELRRLAPALGLLEYSDAGDVVAMREAGNQFYDEPNVTNAIQAGAAGVGAALPVISSRMMSEGVDVFGDAINSLGDDAGWVFRDLVDRLNQPGEVPTMYSNPIQWMERIESSIPKEWLDPKYEKPQWNPISSVSSVRPESDMMPIHSPTNTLAAENSLRLEDFKGSSAIPALGDRSVAGVEIQGVGDKIYDNPTRSLGGADFMRESGTGLWANDLKPAKDLAGTATAVLRDGGDPLMVYTAMGPQSGDFSTMMMESVINDFNPSQIDPRIAQVFDDRIRGAGGIQSWEGLLAPNLRERLENDMTGSQRWKLWQEMDKAAYRDAGLPDINMARRAITDPRLLNATPFDSGLTVGRMTGGLLDSPSVTHPTYNTQIAGDYLGGLDTIAGPILWRDFFENRRNSGAAVGSDQRSFLMNSPRISQKIDQQMIDEYYQMQEAIRGQNDPSSFLRLWTRNQ